MRVATAFAVFVLGASLLGLGKARAAEPIKPGDFGRLHRLIKPRQGEEKWARIPCRHGTFTAIVEPKRETALIGAIVLEDLDLLVDCQKQRVVPRDPRGAVYEIE